MAYIVNGTEEVATLKEVAEVLGVTRVSGKDIKEGKYPVEEVESTGVLTLADVVEASEGKVEIIMVGDAPKKAPKGLTAEAVDMLDDLESHMEELQGTEDGHEEWDSLEALTVAIKEAGEVTEDIKTTYQALTNEEIVEPTLASDTEYPEVDHFKDEKSMKKYIKGLTNEELAEWCELEGAEYNPNEHVSINRMRMAMAIKAIHFPDTAPKAKSKKKSKYSDYSTEDLVQMALDNDVEIRDDKGDPRILRMYTIMALREAGLIG